MAQYAHLQLIRIAERFERRKPGGGGKAPVRDRAVHTAMLESSLAVAIDKQTQRKKPEFIDPSLILRVRMTGDPLLEEWDKLGLTVLSSDADRTLVLCSSSGDLAELKHRFSAYAGEVPEDQKHPRFNAFVATIEEIEDVGPIDRIGMRFRTLGMAAAADFQAEALYFVDVELWEIGGRQLRERKLGEIAAYIQKHGGVTHEQYVGPSITMLRAYVSGALIIALLDVDAIASIDAPPLPDLVTGEAFQTTLDNSPPLNELPFDAPVIGIIDSGVNAHPYLEDILIGSIGVPASLGVGDDWGHGTRIGGVATFGDLREQLEAQTLNRRARLCSAKVVNSQGRFDDRRLVPSQMREAITRLHQEFACRIFVVALADIRKPYDGGKVGAWAATLDELARELDVLIVVSSGNRHPRSGLRAEEGITQYPEYLLEASNRFFEPAGALNVLTVGAIANGEGIGVEHAEDINIKPITGINEPSPFSRIGPGIGGATKPDLVDYGGTLVFDGVLANLRSGETVASAGVLTTHHLYVDRLVTAGSGTSYAAPMVAFKAAEILRQFPTASANLIRALLVGSAAIPVEAEDLLRPLGPEASLNVCGFGQISSTRASYSDDSRVVLYAEDELKLDHFAVYQIPIPDLFQSEPGERSIRVTLAYDPPVRHTRADYTGVGMSYRLVRGKSPAEIHEFFRKRTKKDGRFPELEGRFRCKLLPGAHQREKGTVQCSKATFKQGIEAYGDAYYLVVCCDSGWDTTIGAQQFAVVVEIEHKAEIQLYARIRPRARVIG